MTIVYFPSPDSPEAKAALQQAMERLSGLPMLGLIVKIRTDESGQQEQIANWMLVDQVYLKALATQLPSDREQTISQEDHNA
jgi:predicted alpha/beta-hydrolase family hydrolase